MKRLMTRCRKGDTQYVFDPKDLVAVLFAASFYGLLLLLNLFFYKPSNLYDYNGFYFLGHHLPFYILFIFFSWNKNYKFDVDQFFEIVLEKKDGVDSTVFFCRNIGIYDFSLHELFSSFGFCGS